MRHQKSGRKLNMMASHRRSLLRNQALILIEHGTLKTTKARAKEVKRFVEKLVTVARGGNTLPARRRAKQLLPYKDEALVKLFKEIAPRYTERPGGYTRILSLGRRPSDTADMALVEWV